MKKLDTRNHISKIEKGDREQAKQLLKDQQTELTPASFLDRHEKNVFKKLVSVIDLDATPLSGVDSYQLSLLVLQMNYIALSAQNIKEKGLIIGKVKNPSIAIMNQAIKNSNSLISELGLSYNKRVNSLLDKIQNGSNEVDPIAEMLEND
ncbi:P27 family phage terminase small subunit [Lentilactobacillus kefiri]|uniref:Uncharacterized protein n=4 Tax=Bacilli TaxID=91061 RepID=A0A8E1RK92_LENKE|nr:P27 family phage terminase small subunit [Lentilactobacillus kefiri]KRL73929.1 hypothetical protein FD08_GL002044 [Lentilactobacillus parakefiri DSM 10551]KRM53041.1 hypothetical protein FC95_GL000973 [Lentilactobacillus kefiri DSM 20587 = JCM 5818]GEL29325.1 hypothetical protein LKE01_21450 [Lentilactobacillus kefiri]